jgi:hypothetical protein
MVQTLISTEHEKHVKSLKRTLDGMLTDKDIELGLAFKVISPTKAVITLDGEAKDSFSPKESPWDIRARLDFIIQHYVIGGIQFEGVGK